MTADFVEVTPNILMVPCDFVSVVIAKGEKLAVMDSATATTMPQAILPALAHLGRGLADIDYVINTHGHWDHVQGNPALVAASGAKVWIPAAEMEKLSAVADHFLADGEIIDLGAGLTFQVISTPGHAIGSASFYEPNEQILFSSDSFQGYNKGIPLMFYSPSQYLQSIHRIQELPVETMILGHRFAWSGQPQFVLRGQAHIQQYLRDCEHAATKVAAAIRQAADSCLGQSYHCILETTLQLLRDDPDYPANPRSEELAWGHGSLISSLREMGIPFRQ